ncbi:hypothetical protein J6590_010837 [Homalodisca vitripennis]|nr:hypothetical protein J6590_010837 [Homalodisca vitripennis]
MVQSDLGVLDVGLKVTTASVLQSVNIAAPGQSGSDTQTFSFILVQCRNKEEQLPFVFRFISHVYDCCNESEMSVLATPLPFQFIFVVRDRWFVRPHTSPSGFVGCSYTSGIVVFEESHLFTSAKFQADLSSPRMLGAGGTARLSGRCYETPLWSTLTRLGAGFPHEWNKRGSLPIDLKVRAGTF